MEEGCTKNYELGQVVALEAIERDMRRRAGNFFADGNDEAAKLFRALAEEYLTRAVHDRATYRKKYHGAS